MVHVDTIGTDVRRSRQQQLSETLIERARGLTALLENMAPETEAMRQIPPAIVEALSQAELLSIGTPVALGGHDVDVDTLFEVCYELARGCMSTAWCLQIWSLHAWFLGYMSSSQGQQEVFAEGPDAIISSGYNPNGAKVELVDGGCMLSGKWGFSSGVDHANWILLGVSLPGDGRLARSPLLACARRDQLAIVDDWQTYGLKGSGSKSVVIDEPVFIPQHLYLDLSATDAKTLAEQASYAHDSDATLGFVMAAGFIGAARAVLDAFSDEMRVKVDSFSGESKSDRASIQVRIGESAAEIEAALYLARGGLREMLDMGTHGEALTTELRSTYSLHQVYCIELSRRAVARLFEISGTVGMFASSDMLRRFCDVSAGAKHFAFRWDERTESYGRVRMGLAPNALKAG